MAFARVYELFIRKSLGNDNPIVRSRADLTPREAPHWFARDKFTLRLWLCDEGASQLGPLVGGQLTAGDVIVFAGKAANDLENVSTLFSATPFTKVASGDEFYYEADLDLTSSDLTAAVAAAIGDQLSVLADVVVQNAGNTERSRFQVPIIVKPPAYEGSEGTAADGDPPYPAPSELLTTSTPGVPICRKYSISLAQIQAIGATTSGNVSLATLEGQIVLLDYALIPTQTAAGPSLASAVVGLFSDALGSLMNGVAFTAGGLLTSNTFDQDFAGPLPVAIPSGSIFYLSVDLTGCNAVALTAGTVDVWLTYLVRP